MNRIKHLRAKHSVSYDMIKELHNPESAEEIIKREITLQLANLLHSEFEMEFYQEENPYIGQTVEAEIVAMPLRDWNKIHRFLNQNHFKFSEL
jgi:hypothetical protein